VAVEKGDGIEAVAEVAEMGEEEDGARGQAESVGCGIAGEAFAQGKGGVTKVVAVAEGCPIEAVVREERRDPGEFGDAVDIEEGEEDAIGEFVAPRSEASVAQRAG